jgi:predicted nucleotidyltransferase
MKELSSIKSILVKHIDCDRNEVYYFGSRARKNNRENSDLDILIHDDSPIAPEIVTMLVEDFEESNLPFKVDLVFRSRITNEFFEKIKKDLVKIEFP